MSTWFIHKWLSLLHVFESFNQTHSFYFLYIIFSIFFYFILSSFHCPSPGQTKPNHAKPSQTIAWFHHQTIACLILNEFMFLLLFNFLLFNLFLLLTYYLTWCFTSYFTCSYLTSLCFILFCQFHDMVLLTHLYFYSVKRRKNLMKEWWKEFNQHKLWWLIPMIIIYNNTFEHVNNHKTKKSYKNTLNTKLQIYPWIFCIQYNRFACQKFICSWIFLILHW